MAHKRTLIRVNAIIEEQFNEGDEINSRKMHSALLDKHGTMYLPNRAAISSVMSRSTLLTKVIQRDGNCLFVVL
jgi:hypothetical protein